MQPTKRRKTADIMDVLDAADRLGVPDLTAATVREATRSLTVENVVSLSNLSTSGLSGLGRLQAATYGYLARHWHQLQDNDDLFSSLDYRVFCWLVHDPALCVRDEDELLDAILRRLARDTRTMAEVVGLLEGVRLPLLRKPSLATLSRISRGGSAGPVVTPYAGLVEGVTATVLSGLTAFAADDGEAGGEGGAGGRALRRSQIGGHSGVVLYDLHGDADSVYSPDFFAIGSRWRAHVYECGKEGEPLCLAVKLNRLDNYEGAVQAQVCFWAVCVEGCSYFSQSMEMVRLACPSLLYFWLSVRASSYLHWGSVVGGGFSIPCSPLSCAAFFSFSVTGTPRAGWGAPLARHCPQGHPAGVGREVQPLGQQLLVDQRGAEQPTKPRCGYPCWGNSQLPNVSYVSADHAEAWCLGGAAYEAFVLVCFAGALWAAVGTVPQRLPLRQVLLIACGIVSWRAGYTRHPYRCAGAGTAEDRCLPCVLSLSEALAAILPSTTY